MIGGATSMGSQTKFPKLLLSPVPRADLFVCGGVMACDSLIGGATSKGSQTKFPKLLLSPVSGADLFVCGGVKSLECS